jgi:GT2 family glycosyltransferase
MSNREERALVSIITLNYNGRRFLEDLFDSLRKCTYPNLEIIMVDNCSHDDSVAFVRENYPEVKILQNDKNYLFAGGNNRGLEIASGEYLCVINNDVQVDPGFIEPMVEAFEQHPRMLAGQPKILSMQQRDYFEYAGSAGGFIDWLGYPFVRGRIMFTIEKDTGQYDLPIKLFWASGACIFLRREVLREVGNFDEDFGLHMEEIDLCWRILLAEGEIYSIPRSKIWHYVGGTLDQENPRKVFWNFRNNVFLMVKNLSAGNLLIRLLIRVPLDGVAFITEILKRHFRSAFSILRAYGWLLSHIPLMLHKRRAVQKAREVSDRNVFRMVYPGSIIVEYFLSGRKTFAELTKHEQILHPIMKTHARRNPAKKKEIDSA